MAQKKKKGLGTSFGSLIPTEVLTGDFDQTSNGGRSTSRTKNVLIQDITPNRGQPRKNFDVNSLQDLSESIRVHGILQPIIVAETSDGFSIIAGERRWRAAQMAGLESVPVIVRSMDQQQQMEVALIENLQREDLNLLETATAYLQLKDQFNLKYEDVAAQIGKSVSAIHNIVRMLALPDEAKQAILDNKISEGHARQILALKEDSSQQQKLLQLIINNGWSVRRAEAYVIALKEGAGAKKAVTTTAAESIETKKLGVHLKAKVTVRKMAKGGRLMIQYKNDADLQRITQQLLD